MDGLRIGRVAEPRHGAQHLCGRADVGGAEQHHADHEGEERREPSGSAPCPRRRALPAREPPRMIDRQQHAVERRAPGGDRGERRAVLCGLEHGCDMRREPIRDQHLLGQPEREDRQPERDIVPVDAVPKFVGDLRSEFAPAHDRAGIRCGKNATNIA
jgi:hypothetical protein